jgi:hypothetical protein
MFLAKWTPVAKRKNVQRKAPVRVSKVAVHGVRHDPPDPRKIATVLIQLTQSTSDQPAGSAQDACDIQSRQPNI